MGLITNSKTYETSNGILGYGHNNDNDNDTFSNDNGNDIIDEL